MELLDSGAVSETDLSDFDERVAKEVLCAVKEAKADFPDLHMNYFGSIQSQVKQIEDTIAKKYAKEFYEANKGLVTNEQAEQFGRHNAEQYIKCIGLDNTDNCFAWSLFIAPKWDPTGDELSSFNGIAIHKKYASDYKTFSDSKKHEVAVRHKPPGCDTPRATVDHELGHEIDRMVGASTDSEICAMYEEMKRDGSAWDKLSGYAATSTAEFIAEAYSEYRNNPRPRDYAQRVYAALKRLYQKRQEEKNAG